MIFLVYALTCSCVYAQTGGQGKKHSKKHSVQTVTNSNGAAVSLQGRFVDDKYYVLPGTVYVAPGEIRLYVQGKMIPH